MIRRAVPADAEALARLYQTLVPTPTDPTRLRETLSRLEPDPCHHVLVAEDDARGVVVGTVYAAIVDDVVGEGRPMALVDNLVVAEAVRARGVGTALLEAAEALARSAGCTLIMLVSGAGRHEAHRLYERLGYTVPVRGFKKYL